MVTIKDVASLAGVSVATVSRVINNSPSVMEKTSKRVLAAVKELKYSPNLLGRNLRRLETMKILVLINTMSNQFYARVIKGIEEKAIPAGYTVMVCMTHGDISIEERYLLMLKNRLVDGAVLLTTEQEGEILSRELSDVSVVQACEPADSFTTATVSIDNQQAAFDAVNYLIGKGHRRIAFFGAGNIYDSSVHRKNGYIEALKKHEILVENKLIFDEGFSFNGGARAAKKLMDSCGADMPTACFCVSDSCAAGAMKEFAQCGISTPSDISIMGFDNTSLSSMFIPSITTLKQPQYEIGWKSMELLLEKISGVDNSDKKVLLDYEIIERESVLDITK